jgi:hypothetical protein
MLKYHEVQVSRAQVSEDSYVESQMLYAQMMTLNLNERKIKTVDKFFF